MTDHPVVTRDQWLEARRQLLAREKEFTRLRDELAAARRDLPWVRVAKPYVFDGPRGPVTLAELFAGRRQLVVYHFMFAPEWETGCKSCSFWADNFERSLVHLAARDATLVAISRAPLPKLEAFRKRLGWTFDWVSSGGNDFNYDFGVSFTPEQRQAGAVSYNFASRATANSDLPGISVFYRGDGGAVYHTYSCYARGLDMMNATYQYLDLLPKGRDEAGLEHTMSWVRLNDSYAATDRGSGA